MRSTPSVRRRCASSAPSGCVRSTSVSRYVPITSRFKLRSLPNTWRKHVQCRLRGPMQVVEHEQRRRDLRLRFEPARDRFEQQITLSLRIARRRRRGPAAAAASSGTSRQSSPAAGPSSAASSSLRRVADDMRERLDERLVGHAETVVAAAEQHEAAVEVNRAAELGCKPSLPDPRLRPRSARRGASQSMPLPGDLHLLVFIVRVRRARTAARSRTHAGVATPRYERCERRPPRPRTRPAGPGALSTPTRRPGAA